MSQRGLSNGKVSIVKALGWRSREAQRRVEVSFFRVLGLGRGIVDKQGNKVFSKFRLLYSV